MNMIGKDRDRLSNLPEPIKQYILSFLSTKEAVRTSILSRNWRTLCVGLPSLDLRRYDLKRSLTNDYLFVGDDDISRTKRESILGMREGFYVFLDRVFGSNLELQMAKLYVPGFGVELKARLDGWLDGAVRRGIKELDIEIGLRGALMYDLPSRVFAANSIKKLRLSKFQLRPTSLVEALWPCLDELILDVVHLDQIVIGQILASCQNLTTLTFNGCNGLSKLEISGLPRLQKVDVERIDSELELIKIEAPNLVDFRFYDVTGYACELDLKGCEKMKCMELDGAEIDDDALYDLMNHVPLLECLFISNCHNLDFAEINSKNLVKLAFNKCGYLKKVRACTPKLKYFTFCGEDLVTFVSKGALRLTEATIALKFGSTNDHWYVDLIKLLAKLKHSETLKLQVPSERDLIIPESVRASQRPPLSAVKHFNIVRSLSTLEHPVEVIESLLWLAPRPESISIYIYDLSARKSLKFEYEKPMRGKKKCGCFKSLSNSCWRHSLDKVWIQNKGTVEDDSELAVFLNKSRIDGKIQCFFENTRSEY